jgi:AraC family transcriptional regulator
MHLLVGRSRPYEREEGHFPRHVLTVNSGPKVRYEARLPGQRWRSGSAGQHHVNVWPAGMPHAVRWLGDGNWQVIEVEPGYASGVAASLGMSGPLDLRPALGEADPVAAHLVAALALEAREDGPQDRLVRDSLGLALVGHLLRAHAGAARTGAPRAQVTRGETLRPGTLRRVVDHIQARLDRDLSLADLAGVAGMDLFHFVRTFKATTGQPPHRYVVQARIARAQALLGDGNLTISEVAMQTGFATPSHFSATFRRVTGSTPRGWRGS